MDDYENFLFPDRGMENRIEKHFDNGNGETRKFIRNIATAILITTISNIGLSIWWASSINERVNNLETAILEIKQDAKIDRSDIKGLLGRERGPN